MNTAVQTVSFNEALKFWIKLGFISFGGPAEQIAIMNQEVVEWLNCLNLADHLFLCLFNERFIGECMQKCN